jgi:hemolysin activation/secretion protein
VSVKILTCVRNVRLTCDRKIKFEELKLKQQQKDELLRAKREQRKQEEEEKKNQMILQQKLKAEEDERRRLEAEQQVSLHRCSSPFLAE